MPGSTAPDNPRPGQVWHVTITAVFDPNPEYEPGADPAPWLVRYGASDAGVHVGPDRLPPGLTAGGDPATADSTAVCGGGHVRVAHRERPLSVGPYTPTADDIAQAAADITRHAAASPADLVATAMLGARGLLLCCDLEVFARTGAFDGAPGWVRGEIERVVRRIRALDVARETLARESLAAGAT